jgi:hypothetical protein
MNPLLMSILGSPIFLWNALGVPLNQVRLLQNPSNNPAG